MKHWAHNGLKALTSAWVLALLATVAWSQSLTWLGTLPGGDWSVANGVSANGAVVVGETYYYDVSVGYFVVYGRAFRWTASGGMQDLGTLGGRESYAYGVSADGAVVVGVAQNAGQGRAFRWTASRGMQGLGTLGGNESWAYGVSADGAVVVGVAYNAAWQLRAFRWTASRGMQDLGTLGGNESWARGVSANGTVVGSAQDAAGQRRAVRWTASGIEDLNTTYASLLTNGSVLYEARAISPDGRYIVGYGRNAATNRNEAFLLDTRCTTHNGDVDANGCVDDADLLAVLYAFGNRGSNLGRVDVNCDAAVDDADLLTVLFNFGSGC